MHIGESEIPALETVGETLVIESEQVHEGGLEIVDVNFVFSDPKSQFVGSAVRIAAFYAPARHPHGEAVRIVVATQNL